MVSEYCFWQMKMKIMRPEWSMWWMWGVPLRGPFQVQGTRASSCWECWLLKALRQTLLQELPSSTGSCLSQSDLPSRVSLCPITGQSEVRWGSPLQDHQPQKSSSAPPPAVLSPSGLTPNQPLVNLLQESLTSEWIFSGDPELELSTKTVRKNMTWFRVRVFCPHIYFFLRK